MTVFAFQLLLPTGIGLLLTTMVGYAILSMLRVLANRSVIETVPLSFMVGAGTTSLVAFCVSLFDSSRGLLAVAVLCGVCVALWLLAVSMRIPPWRWPRRLGVVALGGLRWVRGQRRVDGLLIVVLAAVISGVAYIAFSSDLGWDGLSIWGLKAKAFFLEGGVPLSSFNDLSRRWTHFNYPLLVPLNEAWIYYLAGGVNIVLAKALFVTFFISLLALFYSTLDRALSRTYRLIFTLLLAVTPALAFNSTTGYSDVPLSLFVLGSAAYLYRWFGSKRASDLTIAGICAALCIWTKHEGMVIWVINLCAVVVWILASREESLARRSRRAVRYCVPILLVAPWLVFSRWQGLPDNDFVPLSIDALVSHLDRLPVLLGMLVREVMSTSHWGMLALLCLVSIVCPWPPVRRPGERYLLFLVIAYCGLMTASFMFSNWVPYSAHVEASLDRLLLHVAPSVVLFVAVRLSGLGAWFEKEEMGCGSPAMVEQAKRSQPWASGDQ